MRQELSRALAGLVEHSPSDLVNAHRSEADAGRLIDLAAYTARARAAVLRDHADLNWSSPEPGDVVVLRSPADGVDIIKRVIGVAGDRIELRGGELFRNGDLVETQQVGKCTTGTGALQPGCRVYESTINGRSFRFSTAFRALDELGGRVPEKHIYVLGDHRDHDA